MVHPVQAPQGRDGVEHDMLQIDRQIEQQHGQDHSQPERSLDNVEQALAPLLGQDRQTDGQDWERQPEDRGIDHDKCQVVRPTDDTRNVTPPTRGGEFPKRHGGQHTQKRRQTNLRLCG